MKPHLLYADREVDAADPLPGNADDLRRDLGLDTLLEAMGGGDPFFVEVATRVLLSSLDDADDIRYRQQVLSDCVDRDEVVDEIYQIAVAAVTAEKRTAFRILLRGYPEGTLRHAVQLLALLLPELRRLRAIADQHGTGFHSPGFSAFFAMLQRELTDDYFAAVENHLQRLGSRDSILVSARLGRGLKGIGYVLRRPRKTRLTWTERLSLPDRDTLTFRVSPRDRAGMRAISELRDRGVNLAADGLARATDHIVDFFALLRWELAFYLGCRTLHQRLTDRGEPVCFPDPLPIDRPWMATRGLRDTVLCLRLDGPVVGTDADADGRPLLVITGANQGGKSTFLRSLGQAQLMMQCGMPVAAESHRAALCSGVFTHYAREEDASMTSGKLDEELARASQIIDAVRPGGLVLFNESFAATNEREGSQIARHIVGALLDTGIRVAFVTHLYDLASTLRSERVDEGLFLRAERLPDGRRTFRLVAGAPKRTSYGEDLYARIFGSDVRTV